MRGGGPIGLVPPVPPPSPAPKRIEDFPHAARLRYALEAIREEAVRISSAFALEEPHRGKALLRAAVAGWDAAYPVPPKDGGRKP